MTLPGTRSSTICDPSRMFLGARRRFVLRMTLRIRHQQPAVEAGALLSGPAGDHDSRGFYLANDAAIDVRDAKGERTEIDL